VAPTRSGRSAGQAISSRGSLGSCLVEHHDHELDAAEDQPAQDVKSHRWAELRWAIATATSAKAFMRHLLLDAVDPK